ncbi:MAG: hypothetical protein ACI9NY_000023 [Kiritimatiellia bacterium]|jgi:hypothetical protein
MAINWDNFSQVVDAAIEQSIADTDDQLASKISSLTRMTDDEVETLFPQPADVKKLIELMKIVKSSESHNVKVNRIVANAEDFGGVMLTLLNKFV